MTKVIKKAFIVLTHTHVPSKTELGKWEITEKCEFVDSLKNRMYTDATAIVDYFNKKVVKSRIEDATFGHFIEHVRTNHAKEYSKFLILLNEKKGSGG